MRLGLLARADRRGLGHMSADAQKFLEPAATLVVDARSGHPMHLERFPGADVVVRGSQQFREKAEAMLDRIDVLLTLETPYNFELYDWARAKGVRTVLVAMPEYHRPYLRLSQPDLIVNPTPYMHESLPEGSVVLPWPVDLDAFPYGRRSLVGEWLHVVGQPADHDRAGTALTVEAFSAMPDQKLVLRVQKHNDEKLSSVLRKADRMPNIEVLRGETETTGELYSRGAVLIAPRRYAGQSLPANEAAAAGLPLVCLDRIPDSAWTLPELRIPSWTTQDRRFGFEIHHAKAKDLIDVVSSADDGLITRASEFSYARAKAMSWDALKDEWLRVLAGG